MEADCYVFLRKQGIHSPNLSLQPGLVVNFAKGRNKTWINSRVYGGMCWAPASCGTSVRPKALRVCLHPSYTHWKRVKLPSAFLTSEVEMINTCFKLLVTTLFLKSQNSGGWGRSIWVHTEFQDRLSYRMKLSQNRTLKRQRKYFISRKYIILYICIYIYFKII